MLQARAKARASEFQRNLVVCFLLAAATALVFGQVLTYDFVVYDDYAYVAENPHVNTGLSWENIASAFTKTYIASWFPLAIVTNIVDVEIYGLNPGGHHATSLLLHMANALLLFLALKRLTRAHWPSAAVAALFALHPLHVEPAAWISARKDVLSMFFLLLTLLAHERFARKPRPATYLALLLFYALGLLAKSMLVTLPLLLLLLDAWPLGRFTDRKAVIRCFYEKMPQFAMSGIFALATFQTQHIGGAVVSLGDSPVHTRLANAAVVTTGYLIDTLWPLNLAIIYHNPKAGYPLWQVAASILTLACITGLVLYFGRNRKHLLIGWFWYLIALLPVIGLVQIGDHLRADRYTYLPLVGIFVLIVWEIDAHRPSKRLGRRALAAASIAIIALLAILSWRQTAYWRDSVTLFEHAVSVTPQNPIAHINLGVSHARRDNHQEATRHYQEAIRLQPEAIESYSNLGHSLNRLGKYEEAVHALTQSIKRNPQYVKALLNRAVALSALERFEEAAADLEDVIALEPENTLAHNKLGLTHIHLGNIEAAVESFSEVTRIAPRSLRGHTNLGAALGQLGRTAEARNAFERALAIDPEYPPAIKGLAGLRQDTGSADDQNAGG